MKKHANQYVRISIYRKDIFAACGVGFVPTRIGTLWSEGWIKKDKLQNCQFNFEVM